MKVENGPARPTQAEAALRKISVSRALKEREKEKKDKTLSVKMMVILHLKRGFFPSLALSCMSESSCGVLRFVYREESLPLWPSLTLPA